jgi:signal transduction histidine kinase
LPGAEPGTTRSTSLIESGVLLLDRGRQALFADAAARRMFESPDAATCRRRLGPEVEAALDELTRSAAGEVRTIELPLGPRRLRLTIERFAGGSCEGYAIRADDADRQSRLLADLGLAAQLRGLALVHRDMAHHLRGVLASLAVQIELLGARLEERGGDDLTVERRAAAAAREQLRRLKEALDLHLVHARPPEPDAETIDLAGLVREVGGILAPYGERQKVELAVTLPDEPALSIGSRDALRQGLLQLALNGLEAMPSGGRLELRLEVASTSNSVSVYDSGGGIPDARIEQIFELNFTTKTGGTGAGLTVARAIARSHGGEIQVRSELGKGSCFRFEIPRAHGA